MTTWISGYEHLYSVTKEGKIYSHKTAKIRELSGSVDSHGYKVVTLTKEGKQQKLLWHRVVALAFIPCENVALTVDHIDEDKMNNAVRNLRWCTVQENICYYASNEERKKLRAEKKEKRKQELKEERELAKKLRVPQPRNPVKGKAIQIDATVFISIREATRFLLSRPEVTATEDTIRKELRNLVSGKRLPWKYVGKYYIQLA